MKKSDKEELLDVLVSKSEDSQKQKYKIAFLVSFIFLFFGLVLLLISALEGDRLNNIIKDEPLNISCSLIEKSVKQDIISINDGSLSGVISLNAHSNRVLANISYLDKFCTNID